jgi:bifunctional DNase/RNase
MSDMVEVVIDSIRVSLMSQQRIVILREVGADRYLAIWIGPYEAEAITIALQEVEVQRPLTHDLLRNVFQSLNARVLRVEVTSLRSDVYYGNIVAEVNGYNLDIDTRPSDALALAVRANVPILVSQEVMDEVGILPEEDLTDEEVEMEAGEPSAQTQVPEAEIENIEERLSVFEDFLEGLDPNAEDDPKKEDKPDGEPGTEE